MAPQETVPSELPTSADEFLAFGASRGFSPGSSISPAGVGGATAAAMNAIPVPVIRPLVSPGLLTSANVESPYAVDRVTLSYSYYDQFQVLNTMVDTDGNMVRTTSRRQDGFNLHRFDIAAEKTIAGGMASVYVRVPFLDATDNVFDLPLDGIGNVNAGFKVELLHDCQSNDVLSAGLTVAAPTARDAVFTRSQRFDADAEDDTAFEFVDVNPTYLQPWIGAQINGERAFVQGFVGLLVPTDDQFSTVLNANLTVGCSVYEDQCGCGRISSITPVVSVQSLSPVTGEGKLLDFSDQVFVTPGLQVGLRKGVSLNGGVTTPVAGPRAFEIGATAGINFLY